MKSDKVFAALFLLTLAGLLIYLGERARADISVYSPGAGGGSSAAAVTRPISTWPAPTNSFDLSIAKWQVTATSDLSITSFVNGAAAGYESDASVLWITNNQATNITLRVTAGSYTDVGTGARSYTVTNATQRVIAFNKNDMGFHGQSQTSY